MNNTSRFKFYGILTALILVAVGVVWFYPREHSSKVPSRKKAVAAKTTTPRTPRVQVQQPKSMTTAPAAQTAVSNKITVLNAELSENTRNTITSRGSRLYRSPADGTMLSLNSTYKLGLSPEQMEALQKEYEPVFDARLKIEADLAQITSTGENSYKVVIPQYDADAELRDKFYAILDETLSSVGKSQLAGNVQGRLDVENWLWGLVPQVITINYNPDNDRYKITQSNMIDLTGGNNPQGKTINGVQVRGDDLWEYYYIINRIKNIQNTININR